MYPVTGSVLLVRLIQWWLADHQKKRKSRVNSWEDISLFLCSPPLFTPSLLFFSPLQHALAVPAVETSTPMPAIVPSAALGLADGLLGVVGGDPRSPVSSPRARKWLWRTRQLHRHWPCRFMKRPFWLLKDLLPPRRGWDPSSDPTTLSISEEGILVPAPNSPHRWILDVEEVIDHEELISTLFALGDKVCLSMSLPLV
ncbi:hypothetical protein LIER_37475 [Lithospermum erythrorhizon]|uniref:Uncharacterized protein n=1 Tax=Lithospermum erythrorhizon TaxID=34254 RepID=A0AAV3PPX0_LITER